MWSSLLSRLLINVVFGWIKIIGEEQNLIHRIYAQISNRILLEERGYEILANSIILWYALLSFSLSFVQIHVYIIYIVLVPSTYVDKLTCIITQLKGFPLEWE